MANAVLMIPPYLQFFDATGAVLNGGTVSCYSAGTTTFKAIYTDSTAGTQASNPITLDSAGRCQIWGSGSYKFVVKDSAGNTIETVDNVTAYTVPDNSANSYFQSFSGDGSTTVFTTSTSLGTDEKAIMVWVDAGGGKGYDLQNPSTYTINGTSLTFGTAPASGTNNIYVSAPSLLVNAASASASAAATSETNASASATLASQWATLTSGQVAATDYSSKAYAIGGTGVTTTSGKGAAKEWAITTGGFVDTADYSAKEYAIGTTVAAGSAKEWATKLVTTVDGVDYSAKYEAQAAATSASAASVSATAAAASAASATFPIATAGGTVDAITVINSPAVTLADKTRCMFVSAGANTSTTPSFAPDGLTAHTITTRGGAALVAGDIGAAGFVAIVEYNLANTRWELLNPASVDAGMTFTDITTNNASTSKHGFMPKLSNSATLYYDSLGTQTNPALNAVLTGYTSGAGTVAATDTILGAIQKLNGNIGSVAGGYQYSTQTTTYAPTSTDSGKLISFAGAGADATWTIAAGATNGSTWSAIFDNPTTHNLTIKVTTNTIDGIAGATGFIMYPGEARLVQCDGTNYHTTLLNSCSAQFDASGTWTRPPGYGTFRVEIWSSGGSGASRTTTGNAGGGAGGVYWNGTLPASLFVAAGSTETVTVGGAAAGVSGNTAGNTGNASSITVNGTPFAVAGGAVAAATAASSSAAAGGTATNSAAITFGGTGMYNIGAGSGQGAGGLDFSIGGDVTTGNVPEQSTSGFTNRAFAGGGGGASSSTAGGVRTGGISLYAGAGGAGGANTGGNGTDGTAPGGGGGGAVQGGTSGAGAAGRIIIRGVI